MAKPFQPSWPPPVARWDERRDAEEQHWGDPLLEFYKQSRASTDTYGAKALLLAIIDDVIRLIRGGLHPAQHIERQALYHDACRWLDSMDPGDHITFETICDHFGLDTETARKAIWNHDGRTRRVGRAHKV